MTNSLQKQDVNNTQTVTNDSLASNVGILLDKKAGESRVKSKETGLNCWRMRGGLRKFAQRSHDRVILIHACDSGLDDI